MKKAKNHQKGIEESIQAATLSVGDSWHTIEQHWEEEKQQRATWIQQQGEQAARTCKAIGNNQNAVEELQKRNSEGQLLLLNTLDGIEKNILQQILSQIQNQAEDQTDMAQDIKALKKINRDIADKNEITLMQVIENYQNQLAELKKFLKQERENNQEHYQRLTETYAQLTTQDVQMLQKLQEQIDG